MAASLEPKTALFRPAEKNADSKLPKATATPIITLTPEEWSVVKTDDVNMQVTRLPENSQAKEIPLTYPDASKRPRGSPKGKGIEVPMISSVDLGLKVLYQPKDSDETELDIIAVHGIGVDPKAAWNHRESHANWLKHKSMLQADVPNARIMAFNYDSIWFGDTPIKLTLDGVATSLLDELQRNRGHCLDRPILFVAHCFGGLVVQKAFTMARAREFDYPRAAGCMRGIIFLGTPHHGITEGARTATRTDIYSAIIKAELRIQDDIHRIMVQDDAALLSVVNDFTRQVNTTQPPPDVFCYYETKATYLGLIADVNREPELMVNETSGTLSGHRSAHFPLDHFNMNKFQSKDCSHYKHIAFEIKRMAKAASATAVVEPASLGPASTPPKRNRISIFSAPMKQEKNFASRDGILNKIDDAFHKLEKVVLYGDSGLGKTHIAVQYAYKYYEDHPSAGIYWINASTAEQFELSCHLIDESIHNDSHENTDNSKMIETVRHHLQKASKRDLLIVLDGIEDDNGLVATHEPKLSLLNLLPVGGHARILATSRSKSFARRWTNSKESMMRVSQLSPADASFVIFGKVVRETRLKWATEVGQALQFSAGELSLVLQYKDMVGKEFHNGYETYSGKIGASSKSKPDPGRQSGPARSWKPLRDLIKKKNESLLDLMEMICAMNIQCVPSVLFDRTERSEDINLLTRYGVIEPSADERILTVTAMIRDCVKACFSVEKGGKGAEEAAQEFALARVSKHFPSDPMELLPCALSALNFDPVSTQAKSNMIHLQLAVSRHLEGMKQYARALRHVEATKQLLWTGHPEFDQKQAEVKDSLERLKKLMKEVNTSNVSAPNLEALSLEKRYTESHAATPQYLEKEEVKARRSHDMAMLQLLEAKPGNDAISVWKEMSMWSTKKYGDDGVRSATLKFNLGLAYAASGHYVEAETQYKSVLASMEIPGSRTNAMIAQQIRYKALNELARMYCEQHRFEDAGRIFEAVLPGQRALLGDTDPDTLTTRHSFAGLRQEQGDLDGALEELHAVLQDQFAVLGPDDPATMRTACTIALNNCLRGKLAESEKQLKVVLKAQKEKLGDTHYDTVNTRVMLRDVREEMKLVE